MASRRWTWTLTLLMVAGGPVVASLAAEEGEIPTTPLVFQTGEVYLYGHTIDPPYTLVVVDTVLTVNGIPVFPPLQRALPPLASPDELTRRRIGLTSRALELNRLLLAQQLARTAVTDSVAAAFRMDSTLVDSVTVDSAVKITVWWKRATRRSIFLDHSPPPPWEARLAPEVRHWQRSLERGHLVVYCRGWTCDVESDSSKAAVREEIRSATVASPELFDRQPEVLAAERRLRRGTLPDSLRYLLGQSIWGGRHIQDAYDARMFRDPLPLTRLHISRSAGGESRGHKP